MYRSAFVKRVLEIFIGLYGNLRDFERNLGIYGILRVYKKLERKNFFNKMLGVTLSPSPKSNQITLYRQPIYRETSVSSSLRFPQTDCCKYNTCCKSHIFTQSLPQFLLFSISSKTLCPLTPNL